MNRNRMLAIVIAALAIGAFLLRLSLVNTKPSMNAPAGWAALSAQNMRAAASAGAGLIREPVLESVINNPDVISGFFRDAGGRTPVPVLVLAVHPGRLNISDRPFDAIAAEVRRAWMSAEAPLKGAVVHNVELVRLGEMEGIKSMVDWAPAGLRGVQYTLPAGRRTVAVTGISSVDDFPSYEGIFERTTQTVSLPWDAPQWLLSLLIGIGVGGLTFAWLLWSKPRGNAARGLGASD
jgi:hypothetical protein